MTKLHYFYVEQIKNIFKFKKFIGIVTILFLFTQFQIMANTEEEHEITIEQMKVFIYRYLPLNLGIYDLDLYTFPVNPNEYPKNREYIRLDENALKNLFEYLKNREKDFYSVEYIEEEYAEDKIVMKLRSSYTNLESCPSECEDLEIIYNGFFLKEILKYKPFSFKINKTTDLSKSLLRTTGDTNFSWEVGNIITDFLSQSYCKMKKEPCESFREIYFIEKKYPVARWIEYEKIYIPQIYLDGNQILTQNRKDFFSLINVLDGLYCVSSIGGSENILSFYITPSYYGQEVSIFGYFEWRVEEIEYNMKLMSQFHEIITFFQYGDAKIKKMKEDYLELMDSIDQINSRKFHEYFNFILNYYIFLEKFEEKNGIYEEASNLLHQDRPSWKESITWQKKDLEMLEKKHMAYLNVKASSVAESAYHYAGYALVIAIFSLVITLHHSLFSKMKSCYDYLFRRKR